MDWLTSHSAALTAAVTAISALWAGLHHVDKGLKAHLSTQFLGTKVNSEPHACRTAHRADVHLLDRGPALLGLLLDSFDDLLDLRGPQIVFEID